MIKLILTITRNMMGEVSVSMTPKIKDLTCLSSRK